MDRDQVLKIWAETQGTDESDDELIAFAAGIESEVALPLKLALQRWLPNARFDGSELDAQLLKDTFLTVGMDGKTRQFGEEILRRAEIAESSLADLFKK